MSKILIVDDEQDFELLTKQKFRKRLAAGDFNLFFAHNGREALDVIHQQGPMDVVISDINMPEMDGIALLEKLKDSSPRTKTIVASAYGDAQVLRSAMNKGAFDFVTKPVSFVDLENTIDRALADQKGFIYPASTLYDYQCVLAKGWENPWALPSVSAPHMDTTYLFDVAPQREGLAFCGIKGAHKDIPHPLFMAQLQALWKLSLGGTSTQTLALFDEKKGCLFPGSSVDVIFGFYTPSTLTLWTSGNPQAFDLETLRDGKPHGESLHEELLLKSGDVVKITGTSAPIHGTPHPHRLSLAIV